MSLQGGTYTGRKFSPDMMNSNSNISNFQIWNIYIYYFTFYGNNIKINCGQQYIICLVFKIDDTL